MLIADFFLWWYGPGWLGRLADMQHHLSAWAQFFSLDTLLKTLFQPWKQIVTATDAHSSLTSRKNALVDNLVSRAIGFFVRIGVFFFAIFALGAVLIFNTIYVLIWPVLPLLPVAAVVLGSTL